ncbi:hypothetical protein ROHU_017865 [Labeo rohita]|uniref:Uncharacterized protein n=1 Tax=Labeo rohita TaxID=84645 RepID=A0A498NDC0_LABRO|nr:hypothetical protein ROHU_017865 [Labeo rohita]
MDSGPESGHPGYLGSEHSDLDLLKPLDLGPEPALHRPFFSSAFDRRGGTRREMEGQVHVEMETWGLRQGARVEPEGQVKLRATRAGLKTSIAKQMEQETTTAEQEMTTDEQTE